MRIVSQRNIESPIGESCLRCKYNSSGRLLLVLETVLKGGVLAPGVCSLMSRSRCALLLDDYESVVALRDAELESNL